jgi:predicted O-methyltransferase YrrM
MNFDFNNIKHIPPNHSIGDAQIRELFRWASVVDGYAVEVGSYFGRSTSVIALGLKISEKGKKVFAIDPHSSKACDYDLFLKNIEQAGIKEYVQPIRKCSEDVLQAKEPKELFEGKIGLLFIDGDHTYEGLKKDLGWIDYVYRGGVIAFHDYGQSKYPGITKAITEYQMECHKMIQYKLVGGLIMFKKL